MMQQRVRVIHIGDHDEATVEAALATTVPTVNGWTLAFADKVEAERLAAKVGAEVRPGWYDPVTEYNPDDASSNVLPCEGGGVLVLGDETVYLSAYLCESEEQHQVGDDLVSGCITYPVTITTEAAVCSYGQPVVIIDGDPRGPGDMPPGEVQVPDYAYDRVAPRLRAARYQVCPKPVDGDWRRAWEGGLDMGDQHWHPEARLVRF